MGVPPSAAWSRPSRDAWFECCCCATGPVFVVIIDRFGRRDSLLVERRARDRKVASSNPGRNGAGIFFSRVNFLCWLLFGVRSTPLLPQWHEKDPGHSAKSAGGRLHLNMHTPLTQRSRSGLTMLSKNSVGTYHWGKWAHTQLVREHSATDVSALWTIVDWSWPKKWNWWTRADLHLNE